MAFRAKRHAAGGNGASFGAGLAGAGGGAWVVGGGRVPRASPVCGSCRPLLQELLGTDAPPEPARHWRPVAALSLLALAGALLIGLLPIWPMSHRFSAGFTVDKLFIDAMFKQATGYTLLALSLFAIPLALRKRWKRLQFGDFAGWRLVHILLGALALAALAAHTGFRLGDNLNLALIVAFLATLLAGAAGGGIIAFEHRLAALPALRSRRIDSRRTALWLHILASWPLPALLILHIATVYFY